MVKLLILLILTSSFQAFAQVPEQEMENTEDVDTIEVKSIQSYLSPYFYDDNLRNPFIHPDLAIPLKPGATYGPFLPLQQYKLSQLKINGLFWNTAKPKAIISDPKGKTFDVAIKDYIGENFGYVASIREKEIVVIQTLEENGQKYTTTKILFLKNQRREQ